MHKGCVNRQPDLLFKNFSGSDNGVNNVESFGFFGTAICDL